MNKIWYHIAIAVLGLGLLGGVYYHIKEIGRQEVILKQYEEREKQHELMKEEHRKMSNRVHDLQKRLNESTAKINKQAKQLKEKKSNEANTMLAKHLDGRDRLSIPVLSDRPVTSTGNKSSSNPRGPTGTTRYELHPATAQFIINLTERADKITVERNQCVSLLREAHAKVDEYNRLLQKR